MLKVYKNIFYANGKAFRECEPPEQSLPSEDYLSVKPKNLEIDQVVYMLDHFSDNADINANLKTFYDLKNIDSINSLWITISLPTHKHRDWVISHNKIQLEYFIEGYGYTNYLFQNIYKGPADANEKISINATDPDQIWIYERTGNRKKEKSIVITEIADEIKNIFKCNSEILSLLQNIKIGLNTTAKNIYDQIKNSEIPNLLEKIITLVKDFDLQNHKIFPLVEELQCYIHDTKSMFSLEKVWENNKNIKK